MKISATQRLIILSLSRGSRTVHQILNFTDSTYLNLYKTLPELVKADILIRLPNNSDRDPIYALNHDSISVKRVLNSTSTFLSA